MEQKGFTLIELIVVIAIIGILAGIVIAGVNQYQQSAKGAWVIATVNQIQKALELYKAQYGYYPYQAGASINPSYAGIDAASCALASVSFSTALKTITNGFPQLVPSFIGSVKDSSTDPSQPCWTGSNFPYYYPSYFEYETDHSIGGYNCGSPGGPSLPAVAYFILIASPFPISGLNHIFNPLNNQDETNTAYFYLYCAVPPQ